MTIATVTPVSGPLDVPTGVEAVPGPASALVSWQPLETSATGSAITGYAVTSSPDGVVVLTDAHTHQVRVDGLTNGRAYSFTVAARATNGAGPPSAPSTPVVPGTPGPPVGVSATPGTQSISVTWSAPADDNGSPITSYLVVADPGGRTTRVDGTANTAIVGGLDVAHAYRVRVSASNAMGDGPAALSNEVVLGLPAAPSNVRALAGPALVKVAWDPPVSTHGQTNLTRYQITASSGQQTDVLDGAATAGVVTGLTNGTPYTFTVRAGNALGWGPASSSSDPAIPDDAPVWLFPLECVYLIVLLVSAGLYSALPDLRGSLPVLIASVPLAVPWFGALGAVLIGMYGMFDHIHKDWSARYNIWHVARPLTGAVLGIMAYLIFAATVRATGVDPTATTQAQGVTSEIVYDVIAFAVGYREESFRVLFKRALDLFLGPGESTPNS